MIRNTLALVLLTFITSCVRKDHQRDLALLTSYQKDGQTAHLQKNPDRLVSHFHDTLTQLRNGEVTFHTKPEMKERFTQYFNRVEFITWEDTSPPAITISEDATLAQILVQKRVELYEKSDTTRTIEKTNFAWAELWKKKNGEWKLYVVTTTDDQ